MATEQDSQPHTQKIPLAELFVALTSRWRRDDGSLAFGISEADILKKGDLTAAEWRQLQLDLRERTEALGVELVSYDVLGQRWWCCRSLYPVPPELDEQEMTVLATFFYRAQKTAKDGGKRHLTGRYLSISLKSLKGTLVDGGYCSAYAFDRTLRQLQEKGYLKRSQSRLSAQPRLLLEIPEENRQYLADQVERLIV